jgi:twitching motility protein PilT
MTVRIHDLVRACVDQRASDIHFSAGEVPALRVDGEIRRLGLPALSPDDAKRLAYSMMLERHRLAFETQLETDFAVAFRDVARFRVNVYTQTRGAGVVMRRIPTRVQNLDELGMPPVFHRIAAFSRGLVLVTGPTGSGKSTTLAALIDHINHHRAEHILTVEDPVEFLHTPKRCIINQRELGADTRSFGAALRSALREDPDVILVGELRDLETISLAISAAETGHLVFGTLHTNSAAETVDRLIDVFPHDQQGQIRAMLSTSLMAVVSQQLVRKVTEPGRVPAQEILIVNAAVRNLIRENKLHQVASVMQAGRQEGMQTMDMAARDLVQRRRISREDAIRITNNPRLFDEPGVAGPGGAVRPPGPMGGAR